MVAKTQIFNLLNKPIGLILVSEQRHKRVLVNGYTGERVDPNNINLANPENVWVSDITSDTRPNFVMRLAFDPKSKLTFTEKERGFTDSRAYNKSLGQALKYVQRELTPEKIEESRLKSLKSQLSSHGIEFDPSRFVSKSGISINEEIPY